MTSLTAVLVTDVNPRQVCAGTEGKQNSTHSQPGATRRWVIRTRLWLLYPQLRLYIYVVGGTAVFKEWQKEDYPKYH